MGQGLNIYDIPVDIELIIEEFAVLHLHPMKLIQLE